MEALNKIIAQVKELLAPLMSGSTGADTASANGAAADPSSPSPTWQDKAKTYAAQAKEQAGPQMDKAKTYAAQAKEQAGPQMEKAKGYAAQAKEQAGPQVAKVKDRINTK